MRKNYVTKLTVNSLDYTIHNPCISYCLRYVFEDYDLVYSEICKNYKKLFTFFDKIKANISIEIHEFLNEYQNKLI